MAGKTEIGALSVKLTAEASEFNKAVDKAQVKLHGLAKGGANGLDLHSLTGGLAGGLKNPIGALSEGLGGLGTAAGGPVGVAIGAAKAGFDKLW